jgi:hypothetical protein
MNRQFVVMNVSGRKSGNPDLIKVLIMFWCYEWHFMQSSRDFLPALIIISPIFTARVPKTEIGVVFLSIC